RPGEDLVVKRCKHGLRAVLPALGRMALDRGVTATGHIDRARQVRTLVRADMSVAERRAVQLSVLPVYVSHDEYLFLRVLQSFETTFVLLAMDLRAAIEATKRSRTAVLTKLYPTRSHTGAAQGGMAAALANVEDDNWEWHTFDTVKGGDYLVDQDAAEILAKEAIDSVLDL
ncbi:hypothetical protein ADL27_24330, partial [Streptomyces sp. NRRL F-6602]